MRLLELQRSEVVLDVRYRCSAEANRPLRGVSPSVGGWLSDEGRVLGVRGVGSMPNTDRVLSRALAVKRYCMS